MTVAPLPSTKLTRLLLAYTLCCDAVHAQRLHTDFVKDTLFFAGVTAYYSALSPRDVDWLKVFLTEPDTSDLLDEETLRLRYNVPLNLRYDIRDTDGELGNSLWSLFDKFKRIRNKDIAHRDSGGSGRGIEPALVRVPENVAGGGNSDLYPYGLHIHLGIYPAVDIVERYEFTALVASTIDIYWAKEKRPIPTENNE